MAIKKIVVVGNANITSDEIQRISESYLNDTYLGLFSKRNAFIYPKQKIEKALTNLYPRISEVGMETESFEILNIKVKEREATSIWCAAIQCYLADENGYLFAEYHEPALDTVASTTDTDENLIKLFGGDQLVGPEPIGKSIFTKKLYFDIQNTVVELQKIGITIDSVHVFSRDEIVFNVSTGGKLIFSDRKTFEDSLDDLKSSLSSSVFVGTSSTNSTHKPSSISTFSSSSSPLKITLPPYFEYIDVRFGNKVFYKIDKNTDEKVKASSTVKN
ncbi:MAG: FtsQ-type POTRA domain-containing protein [Candidatus Pacebacteria bacterium]|nr:FtsQ-type POTRA domain-containing protein [Candidatus Paceibacterota bacterium]